MEVGPSLGQEVIGEGIAGPCRRFGDNYWRDQEAEVRFPREYHRAMAAGSA